METVLLTGGAGFIGSHLAEELLAAGYRVVVVDDLSAGFRENLPLGEERLIFYEGSVTDKELIGKLFREFSFDYIFHYAALASVQLSIREPIISHRVNFDSTMELLEAARGLPFLKRFIFAGSAAVYGDRPALPCREDGAVSPITPYGVDKYSSERYILNGAPLYNLSTTVLRYFNVYGPRQSPASPYSGVLSIFTEAFRTEESPEITIFGDGSQTRDFVYVKDVVRANLLLMRDPAAIGELFNMATGRELSLLEVVRVLERVFERRANITFKEARSGDIRRSYADIGRIEGLDFRPHYDIEAGLREYREWLLGR